MLNALSNLNILEILRLGLTGLSFLLSLLAFWLIHREQQRAASPRKGILHAIYTFMAVNFLTAVLVAMAGYLGPQQQRGTAIDGLAAKTYLTPESGVKTMIRSRAASVGGSFREFRVPGLVRLGTL